MIILKVYGIGAREFNVAKLTGDLRNSLRVQLADGTLLDKVEFECLYVMSTGGGILAEVTAVNEKSSFVRDKVNVPQVVAAQIAACLKETFPQTPCRCVLTVVDQLYGLSLHGLAGA